MIGAWFGAGLVMKKGINIAKPCSFNCALSAGCEASRGTVRVVLIVKLIGEQLGLF